MTGNFEKRTAFFLAVIMCMSLVCMVSAEQGATSQGNETQIARDVYIYGYPLVLEDITKAQLTNVAKPDLRHAPVNQFVRAPQTLTPRFSAIVSPNVDTLYANAFLDLRREPIVMSVPDTQGRYYLIPLLDSWSNVFSSPGTRTTGNGPGNFLIYGPGWNGSIPSGMTRIPAPTNTVWLVGRTLVNSSDPADVMAARAVQDKYMLTPLSAWGTNYTPPSDVPVDPSVDMATSPADQIANMTPARFYIRFSELLADNPPPGADAPTVQEMAQVGIVPGKSFDWNGTDRKTRDALAQGASEGLAEIAATANARNSGMVQTNNWLIMNTGGSYGTRYLDRATTAWTVLGANLPEDTVYCQVRTDADGQLLDGSNRYIVHFGPNGTPPVRGFWSITLYNNRQFLVNNSINRYAVGDRSPLMFNSDGSLDIYVQQDSPGPGRESNWLPAPAGGFNLFLREYWPSESVITKTWIPPPVTRVTGALPTANPPATQPTPEQSPIPPVLVMMGLISAGLIIRGKRP